MPDQLAELRKELRVWEKTLHAREVDEARRIVQEQNARRRAVDHRSQADAQAQRHLYNEAKRRLRSTRHAIEDARHAIHDKRVAIHGAEHNGRKDAVAWWRHLEGRHETPAGTNCTPFLIHSFGLKCCAWCGKACGNAMVDGGKLSLATVSSVGILSVAAIEDAAKAGRGPFSGWSTSAGSARMGDLVVLFGRGVHVGMVRGVGHGVLETYEGNTGPSNGSQSNGGGVWAKTRAFSVVHGIAHVNY